MRGRLPISLLSALAWGRVANAMAGAEPQITPAAILPRQQQDNFIGWVEASGTWFSQTCNPGLTWYQNGEYAQCCPTTVASCYAPTACVSGSLIYPYSDISSTTTIACTDNFNNPSYSICNTAFIFENFDDSSPQTDIICGESSVNWSYYRKIPSSATESVPTIETGGSTGITTRPSPVTTSTPPPSPPPIPPTPPPTPKKKSNAWIAGAVVGPIVGLAFIGLIAFLLFRRKKKNAAVPGINSYYGQDQYNQQPLSPAPQYQAPYQQPGSPPPAGVGAYAPDLKPAYQQTVHPEVAELGGGGSITQPPSTSYTAELSGETAHK